MEWIAQYVLSIVAASLICGAANTLAGQGKAFAAVLRLLTGIILAITLVQPLLRLDLSGYTGMLSDLTHQSEQIQADAAERTEEAYRQCIKERAEAYILDKAVGLGAQVAVTVTLSDEPPYAPCAVSVSGSCSPYARSRLAQIMEEDLAIAKEAQEWT